ncbi:hypothetical protein PENTCL1PPCAC_6438 [Pristionchus entomophagus]|uniref:PPM-type phosphatase domain-containing protein n=1 Tax=Pristionchus entomophagus TaxID=358040 RepID=A0AAV5SQ63_9BILA|nr:hypothetical protein PENTCL1PPCAC_6438 [Pristionchus entomophagus]
MAKHKSSFSLYDDDDLEEEPVIKKAKEVAKSQAQGPSPSPSQKPKEVEIAEFKYELFYVMGSRRGERVEMEDDHICLPKFVTHEPRIASRTSLYSILDGHGGARASTFCATHLPNILKKLVVQHKSLDSLEKGMKKLMTDMYKSVDTAFLKEARSHKPAWKDGTTCTTLYLLNDVFYVANIGDSKAIVFRQKTDKNVIVELTEDHNPQKYEERERIEKAGGVVKNGRIDGVIEVSRSIGDGQFKTRGVTCTPHVKKFTLTAEDKFIIVACDGLWKSFSNEDAVQFVLNSLKKSEEKEEVMERGKRAQWELVASEMAAEAVRRRCGDNVSLLILVLDSA